MPVTWTRGQPFEFKDVIPTLNAEKFDLVTVVNNGTSEADQLDEYHQA